MGGELLVFVFPLVEADAGASFCELKAGCDGALPARRTASLRTRLLGQLSREWRGCQQLVILCVLYWKSRDFRDARYRRRLGLQSG